MLYEIFVSGKPVMLFFTTKPFTAHDARRLVGDPHEPVSIKKRRFEYDKHSMVVLEQATQESIGRVIGAYIEREVERCGKKLQSTDSQNLEK